MTKPKIKWCEHIYSKEFWVAPASYEKRYMLREGFCNNDQEEGDTDGWEYCPICGKPRPKKGKHGKD